VGGAWPPRGAGVGAPGGDVGASLPLGGAVAPGGAVTPDGAVGGAVAPQGCCCCIGANWLAGGAPPIWL
jgi:hypothetical protein